MPKEHCASVGDAVALLAGDPLLFEPRTQHRYSVWGWVLASAVVEGAARERFDRFITHQLFEPLGMHQTVAAETDDLTEIAHRGRRPDYSCIAGGGAFLSTPSDLVRFGSATTKPGVLRADTIAALQTPTRLASGASTTYALGWTIGGAQIGGAASRVVSHRGSPAGGTVSLVIFPDLGVVIAAAANASDATGVHPFVLQVADAFSRELKRAPPS
jgi:serine beta-lactamase-like protein LACTB